MMNSIWKISVITNGVVSSMTVIDPQKQNDEDFKKSQEAVFGKKRILKIERRS